MYFHGVKTRLSTLGTGDVPRGSDSLGGHKRTTGGWNRRRQWELDWDYIGN